ncbi:TolC family protein [Plebeiibacterium marinum]|uniref:TolC family protein n=1 Tax=Plebeiibacterium marinum TaxID=2992111 RepID=A0AAE3MD84_9BACT|nr:TolC family protein [Plebeiobacterium marinum]MCW3805437.1 TolC family protein [Plebeiobacterium marinum]
MYRSFIFTTLIFLGVATAAFAQQTGKKLTLEEAISVALTNNHELKIADNTLKQTQNSNSIGNAGLLPSVTLNGGASYSSTNSETDPASGTGTVSVDGAETTSYNGNVRVDYTLFDGFGNQYTYKKLKQTSKMQETLFKQQMELTIIQVVQSYYEVCRNQQNLQLAQESMEISKERYSKAIDRKAYGQANQLEVLNAEVDMNTDSANVLVAEQSLAMSVKDLNVVLGIPVQTMFNVDDHIDFNKVFQSDEVTTKALKNNSSLISQLQQESISQLDFKVTRSTKYPTLSAYGTYSYNNSEYTKSDINSLQTDGLTGGVSLRLNVFNGRQQNTRESNARLAYLSQQERTRQIESQLERDASNAYTDFIYKKRIADLQQTSLTQAELNFDKTKEMFKLGNATSIEFRTAQQNMLNAANNYNNARFNAKIAEYNLLQITGELVQ